MTANILRLALAGVAVALGSCSDRADPARVVKAKHAYHAPHQGTIVRLVRGGQEEYHLEFVLNATTGRLTAYLLDAEAQDAVRARSTSFDLVATIGAEKRPLTLQAMADSPAGETIGGASRFEGQAEWLKNTPRFYAELSSIKIRDTTFLHVPFNFPKGNERP